MCILGKNGFELHSIECFVSFFIVMYVYVYSGQSTTLWISFFFSFFFVVSVHQSQLARLVNNNYLLNYRVVFQFLSCLCNKILRQIFNSSLQSILPGNQRWQGNETTIHVHSHDNRGRIAHMPTAKLSFCIHTIYSSIQGNGAIHFQGGFSHINKCDPHNPTRQRHKRNYSRQCLINCPPW